MLVSSHAALERETEHRAELMGQRAQLVCALLVCGARGNGGNIEPGQGFWRGCRHRNLSPSKMVTDSSEIRHEPQKKATASFGGR